MTHARCCSYLKETHCCHPWHLDLERARFGVGVGAGERWPAPLELGEVVVEVVAAEVLLEPHLLDLKQVRNVRWLGKKEAPLPFVFSPTLLERPGHLCVEGRQLRNGARGRGGNARAQVSAVHEVISDAWQVRQVGWHVDLRYLAQVRHIEVVLWNLQN